MIELTEIVEGPKVIMTGIYDGYEGVIVRLVTPTAFEIRLKRGMTVTAGRDFFRIIGVDDEV